MVFLILALSIGPAAVLRESAPLPDEPTPSEFWRAPTAQIGMPDGPFGIEITPEGDLYTGFHEFFTTYGRREEPGRIGIRTALLDYLPIYRWRQAADGITYNIEAFGVSSNGRNDGPLVSMLSVTARNAGRRRRTAHLSAGFRYRKESVYRPKPRIPFHPDWSYGFAGGAAIRGGRILGLMAPQPFERVGFPDEAVRARSDVSAPGKPSSLPVPFRFRGGDAGIDPGTPVLRSRYSVALSPGGIHRWVFKVPHSPAPFADRPALTRLHYDRERERVIRLWRRLIAGKTPLSVPDRKIMGLARSALVALFIGRDTQGSFIVPRVNELHYDGFYLRDGAFMIRALDVTGYPKEAGECLRFILSRQKTDGSFQSQSGQLDGWGQALWALGQHARITDDRDLSRRSLPAVARAVDWLVFARRRPSGRMAGEILSDVPSIEPSKPGGLLPPANPMDNEQIGGHLFGHDFWAYRGLWEAAWLAAASGDASRMNRWERERSDYHRAIERALETATARTGGPIPPALEPGGYDWGNLKAVYPCRLLSPFDPRVTATLRHARSRFNEGMMTYANRDTLHGYIGFDIPMTELRRGERKSALDALFSAAAHTTAANGGFEYGSARRRDYGKNLSPHGCWAAKFLALLRDCLLYEDASTLHLGGGLSPDWLRPGRAVAIRDAPSDFGPVRCILAASQTRRRGETTSAAGTTSVDVTLRLSPDAARRGLRRVVLHAPIDSVIRSVDGPGMVIRHDADSIDLRLAAAMRTTGGKVHIELSRPADSSRWTAAAYQRRYCFPPVVK